MPEKPTENFDINAPWRDVLPKVDMSWVDQQITKQMEGDPGFRNQIGRASEERYAQDLARRAAHGKGADQQAKPDGLSALDAGSRERLALAVRAIEKVNWSYERSPDRAVLREGFKNMRAAHYALDAVVEGGGARANSMKEVEEASRRFALNSEAASVVWQSRAPKMASDTKEFYRPEWFIPERLRSHSWDQQKIAALADQRHDKAQSSPQITAAESRWAAKIASGAAIAKESGEARVQGSNASQSA